MKTETNQNESMRRENSKLEFQKKLPGVLNSMKEKGVHVAYVNYRGELKGTPHAEKEIFTQLLTSPNEETYTSDKELEDALEEIFEYIMEWKHPNWDLGHGSEGAVLFAPKGTFEENCYVAWKHSQKHYEEF